MAENELLNQLEGLLSELFSGGSSNERIAEINQRLDNFSRQSESWKYCLYFMHHSEEHNVWMYSLNIIENFCTRLWATLLEDDQEKIWKSLWQLLNLHTSIPNFVRNKIVKVIVGITRVEWPRKHSDFFQTIYQVIENDSSTTLGLNFLKIASEELGTPRDDQVTTARQAELKTLLTREVTTMLPLLLQILNRQALKQKKSSQSVPPPSPVYPHSREADQTGKKVTFTPLDTISEEICSLCMKCLAHLFSWLPLSHFLTTDVIEVLFHFVMMGCESENDCTDSAGTLGHLALGCINELLQQSCVPKEFHLFLMHLFEKTFVLLKTLTEENDLNLKLNYASLDDRYLEKCNEYLRLLVSSHIRRVESNPLFPVVEFLVLFHNHTFKQPQLDGYYICLDAWTVFLDHVIASCQDIQSGRTPPVSQQLSYPEVLLHLMDAILKKVLMSFNTLELQDLDDDQLDADNETEWQAFIRQSVEVFAKIAELYPTDAFGLLLPLFQEYSQAYVSLQDCLVKRGSEVTLNISVEHIERLYTILRDLSTVTQMLGRLAEHFSGQYLLTRLESAKMLFQGFCEIADFSLKNEVYIMVTDDGSDNIEHLFIEVPAHSLGALNAFCRDWLPGYHLASLRGTFQDSKDVTAYIATLFQLGIPLLSREVPERIAVSAGQMLLTLTNTVRYCHSTQLPIVQQFIIEGSKGQFNSLPLLTRKLAYRVVSNIFVLPWPEMSDSQQHWDSRAHEHEKFMTGALKDFSELQTTLGLANNDAALANIKGLVLKSLTILEDVVLGVAEEATKPKNVLYSSVKKFIELSTNLFQPFLSFSDVLIALMSLFLTVFRSLSTQLGQGLTENTIQTIMQLLGRQSFQEMLANGDKLGCEIMEKFIHILIHQVSPSNSHLKVVLRNVVSFALESIYPVVSELAIPDVKSALYDLFTQILLNWRYVFPANVLSHVDQNKEESFKQNEQFVAIMEAYLKSFLQEDLNIFKQNIKALLELHKRYGLFAKLQFRNEMLVPFLKTLLGVLVHKSHDLLREEICAVLYSLASVDFALFHQEFLPAFLSNFNQLQPQQKSDLAFSYKTDEDFPSFIKNISQFASDLRYYLLLHSSLPQGSVRLG